MADSQDVNTLRRRGRRRLVGAIALVLLAVLILPMVFDQEPRRGVPPVNLRIPSEDESSFAPKTAPAAAETPSAETKPAGAGGSADAERKPEPVAATPPEAKPDPKPEAKAAPKAEPQREAKPTGKAESAPGEQFVVQIAALASAEKLQELVAKLKAARLPYTTEQVPTAKGPVTRVRAGPFSSREAAEAAQKRLESLGLKPGKVLGKS